MKEVRPVVLIGLGDADRGDDGAGPALATRLAGLDLPGVEVRTGARDAAWILDAWARHESAVVVDCIRSGQPVGTVRRIDPSHGPLVDRATASTHGLGLASAVELGRALGDLPRRLALVGIEGGSFAVGSGMSPEVCAALPVAASMVVRILTEWRVQEAQNA